MQEERSQIIQENILLLIKELTQFEEDDKRIAKLNQSALKILRKNNLYEQPNSHNGSKHLEAMCKKLEVENLGDFSVKLEKMCNVLVKHPSCASLYENDITWSIIKFLLLKSYKPTTFLRQNPMMQFVTPFEISNEEKEMPAEEKQLLQELIDELPDVESFESDSELSDWSETDDSDTLVESSDSNETPMPIKETRILPWLPPLKKPERDPIFKFFDTTYNEQNLIENVQHSWWFPGNRKYNKVLHSDIPIANSADLFHQHCMNLRRIPEGDFETSSTHNLLREIIWMFHSKLTCKFFYLDPASNQLHVRSMVTIPSLMKGSLHKFLENEILPYIEMMNELDEFTKSVFTCKDFTPTHTVESYAANLRTLLNPIWEELINYERLLIEPKDDTFASLIDFTIKLKKSFEQLKCLHKINSKVVRKLNVYAPHICSAKILAALLDLNMFSDSLIENHMTIALFLSTVGIFCTIIDMWWTQGRLEDNCQEFLVERIGILDHAVQARKYTKSKTNELKVSKHDSDLIRNSRVFDLLLDHCLQCGRTLNLLSEIKQIVKLKELCAPQEEDLHTTFLNEVLSKVRDCFFSEESNDDQNCEDVYDGTDIKENTCKTNTETDPITETTTTTTTPTATEYYSTVLEPDEVQILAALLANETVDSDSEEYATNNDDIPDAEKLLEVTDSTETIPNEICEISPYADFNITIQSSDHYMLYAFASNIEATERSKLAIKCKNEKRIEADENDWSALKIYNILKNNEFILPFENMVYKSFLELLKKRIEIANKFVIDVYVNEFEVIRHLRNVRQVLLLETSDLMYQFYSNVFKQIENNLYWANSFSLTAQLDDILTGRHPELSNMFHVVVNSYFRSQTNKVYDAIDELAIGYDFSPELRHLITEENMEDYNRAFRFLLKIKWGLMALENLQFAPSRKCARPYGTLTIVMLIMRRFEQLRFWLLNSIAWIHSHLMTHVLQLMGKKLETLIVESKTIRDFEIIHATYINTVIEYCFLDEISKGLKLGVEQFLNLVYVLRVEWQFCVENLEQSLNPFKKVPQYSDNSYGDDTDDFIKTTQIDQLEVTFIRCHEYFVKMLNRAVFVNNQEHLSGLCAAFSSSMPY